MIRYDYTDYAERLNSLYYTFGELHQRAEDFQDYVRIIENFDLVNHPPEEKDRRRYIFQTIVPIMQEYSRDFLAVLEIDEEAGSIIINLICNCMIVIKEEKEIRDILHYADLFAIKPYDGGRVMLSLHFSA